MRVALTKTELETDVAQELLALIVRITSDGKLELDEIVALRKWLRTNKDNGPVSAELEMEARLLRRWSRTNKDNRTVRAIPYLHDIMTRITSDGVIDRDELLELHLAIERVIPTAHRGPIIQARKKREVLRRERLCVQRQVANEKTKEERKQKHVEEHTHSMRLRHSFAKVAGVTFPNDDGSERQAIIKRCKPGEQLVLKHDSYNKYSIFATAVCRMNREQLGHAPEYLAERIVNEIEDGFNAIGVLAEVTGGTFDKPTYGANFVVFFVAKNVTDIDLQKYIRQVLANRT